MSKLLDLARKLSLAAAVASSPAVLAAPVSVTAGQTAIWNFDLTGTLPGAPPFTGVYIIHDASSGGVVSWDLFAELDAEGDRFGHVTLNSAAYPFLDAGGVDGIFSLRLIVESGSVDVETRAFGYQVVTASGDWVYPTAIIFNAVPEPSTLGLTALGVFAAAAARRRK